ncbi:MAG: transcriptional regulator NrdR [Candidatus Magasanikbacteria bacterium]|jgi:transcriptional repressor NrdR
MRCPVCNNRDTAVVDTRPAEDGFSVRRRRECEKCHYRFSTIEEMELLDIVVVKADGRRESYLREKIENGIRRSLTKRPYLQDNFHSLIHDVERDIQKRKKRELSSKELGEIVMKRLRGFDKVAYIRFASVYRDFKDVKTFEKELSKLKKAQ